MLYSTCVSFQYEIPCILPSTKNDKCAVLSMVSSQNFNIIIWGFVWYIVPHNLSVVLSLYDGQYGLGQTLVLGQLGNFL
jgi:hypothetical protein